MMMRKIARLEFLYLYSDFGLVTPVAIQFLKPSISVPNSRFMPLSCDINSLKVRLETPGPRFHEAGRKALTLDSMVRFSESFASLSCKIFKTVVAVMVLVTLA